MLTQFLETAYSAEQVKVIVDAIDVLGHYNLTDVINQIEEIAMNETAYDTYGKIVAVNATISENLERVLNLHSVFVDRASMNLKQLTACAETLYTAVEDYDPTWLTYEVSLEVTDANTTRDIFANLVGTVTKVSADDIIDHIHEVDASIIISIQKMLEIKEVPNIPAEPSNHQQVEAYKSWLNGRRTGVVFQAITSGMFSVGQFAAATLAITLDRALGEITQLDELAFELASIIKISNDKPDDAIIQKLAGLFTTGPAASDELQGLIMRTL